jgi:hypothetical protein
LKINKSLLESKGEGGKDPKVAFLRRRKRATLEIALDDEHNRNRDAQNTNNQTHDDSQVAALLRRSCIPRWLAVCWSGGGIGDWRNIPYLKVGIID